MITMYKLVNALDRIWCHGQMQNVSTSGHTIKIRRPGVWEMTKKYSLLHRVVDTRNSLEDDMVKVVTVKQFKKKLEKCRYGDCTFIHCHTVL